MSTGKTMSMGELSAAERDSLRSNLRSFFEANSGEAAVRRLVEDEGGLDRGVWRDLTASLGVAGVLAPEADGGLGLGYREMMVVLEEGARALYSGPVMSSATLAPAALLASGDAAACADYLPGLAEGARIIAVAVNDAKGQATRASGGAAGWRLTGTKTAVIDGAAADAFLLTAQTDAGVGLFAVEAQDAQVTPLDVLDRTRRQASVVLADAPARRIGGDYADGLALLSDVGAAAAAAEQLGVSQRMLEITVEYAKVREQFGRPIGSFQAIKHICADMLARTEGLRAAVGAAGAALGAGAQERAEVVSVAKAHGSETAAFVTQNAIQVLGGIGFTWEHPAHLYLRRARTLQTAFGDAAHHRARIGAIFGLGGASR